MRIELVSKYSDVIRNEVEYGNMFYWTKVGMTEPLLFTFSGLVNLKKPEFTWSNYDRDRIVESLLDGELTRVPKGTEYKIIA